MARQVLFTGVEGFAISAAIATAVGVVVVVQTQAWLTYVGGDREMSGPLLWKFIVREIAPLIANLVVVGRSGTAISTELASMRVREEIDVLQSQGIEPTAYLIMPRVLAVGLSVLLLGVTIIACVFANGYVLVVFSGIETRSPALFFDSLFAAADVWDLCFSFQKHSSLESSLERSVVARDLTFVVRPPTSPKWPAVERSDRSWQSLCFRQWCRC